MNKLKTLKDFCFDEAVEFLLKQEAIKWVKELKKTFQKDFYCLKHNILHDCCEDDCSCPTNELLCNADYEATDSSGAIKIIKHFFNLTEEDLQ